MAKLFSKEDVAAHKKPDDLWVVVDDDVYNLTDFQTEHPGRSIPQRKWGKDGELTHIRRSEELVLHWAGRMAISADFSF